MSFRAPAGCSHHLPGLDALVDCTEFDHTSGQSRLLFQFVPIDPEIVLHMYIHLWVDI